MGRLRETVTTKERAHHERLAPAFAPRGNDRWWPPPAIGPCRNPSRRAEAADLSSPGFGERPGHERAIAERRCRNEQAEIEWRQDERDEQDLGHVTAKHVFKKQHMLLHDLLVGAGGRQGRNDLLTHQGETAADIDRPNRPNGRKQNEKYAPNISLCQGPTADKIDPVFDDGDRCKQESEANDRASKQNASRHHQHCTQEIAGSAAAPDGGNALNRDQQQPERERATKADKHEEKHRAEHAEFLRAEREVDDGRPLPLAKRLTRERHIHDSIEQLGEDKNSHALEGAGARCLPGGIPRCAAHFRQEIEQRRQHFRQPNEPDDCPKMPERKAIGFGNRGGDGKLVHLNAKSASCWRCEYLRTEWTPPRALAQGRGRPRQLHRSSSPTSTAGPETTHRKNREAARECHASLARRSPRPMSDRFRTAKRSKHPLPWRNQRKRFATSDREAKPERS